jgi:hypothetical protein
MNTSRNLPTDFNFLFLGKLCGDGGQLFLNVLFLTVRHNHHVLIFGFVIEDTNRGKDITMINFIHDIVLI